MTILYGIDTSKKVSAQMVKEALVECFYDAHYKQTGISGETDKKTNKDYCDQIVKKAFLETGGNFDEPTKESLLNVLPWLAEFSKSFRNQDTIDTHMKQITELISLTS